MTCRLRCCCFHVEPSGSQSGVAVPHQTSSASDQTEIARRISWSQIATFSLAGTSTRQKSNLCSSTILKAALREEEASRIQSLHGIGSHGHAITQDLRRVFSGNDNVDRIRLRLADMLVAYTQKDLEIGYVQGMGYVAAIVCLHNSRQPDAERAFETLMSSLRCIYLPDFNVIFEGVHILAGILHDRDLVLAMHLLQEDRLTHLMTKLWLQMFATWVHISVLFDLALFTAREGLPGLLCISLQLLRQHRNLILECNDLVEMQNKLKSLRDMMPPDHFLENCVKDLPNILEELQGCSVMLSWSNRNAEFIDLEYCFPKTESSRPSQAASF